MLSWQPYNVHNNLPDGDCPANARHQAATTHAPPSGGRGAGRAVPANAGAQPQSCDHQPAPAANLDRENNGNHPPLLCAALNGFADDRHHRDEFPDAPRRHAPALRYAAVSHSSRPGQHSGKSSGSLFHCAHPIGGCRPGALTHWHHNARHPPAYCHRKCRDNKPVYGWRAYKRLPLPRGAYRLQTQSQSARCRRGSNQCG